MKEMVRVDTGTFRKIRRILRGKLFLQNSVLWFIARLLLGTVIILKIFSVCLPEISDEPVMILFLALYILCVTIIFWFAQWRFIKWLNDHLNDLLFAYDLYFRWEKFEVSLFEQKILLRRRTKDGCSEYVLEPMRV